MVCLAGVMGNDARKLLEQKSQLLPTFKANSHFEAMKKYYKLMDWGKYATDQDWDYQEYSDEWNYIQLNSISENP